MLKKILFFLLALVPATIIHAATSQPMLILDTANQPQLPRNFRMTSDAVLPDLHMAGGAQFSELGLQQILRRLPARSVTIIDLRQESHGFLNGNAISWYGVGDAANLGKTAAQVEEDQSMRLRALSRLSTATVYEVLAKTPRGAIGQVNLRRFAVKQVMSEEELARRYQVNYFRIYVTDFHAPTADQVDRFIQFTRNVSSGMWLYFHCHAGRGRTTTAMAMYDMMHHAKQDSFDGIILRQAKMGGKDLEELPSRQQVKFAFAEARLQFLHLFYNYCRANQDNFRTTWSEWLAKSHPPVDDDQEQETDEERE